MRDEVIEKKLLPEVHEKVSQFLETNISKTEYIDKDDLLDSLQRNLLGETWFAAVAAQVQEAFTDYSLWVSRGTR